jgi:DNA-binding GntR family transcriptional regulator
MSRMLARSATGEPAQGVHPNPVDSPAAGHYSRQPDCMQYGHSLSKTKQPTATERIRSALADDIVRGQIGPGVVLDEASIAERFAVSRTPVREAIRQLEAIGFVVARPHRGAVVPHFTPEKLTEMFDVMAEMEALCAAFAADNITEDGRSLLQAAHDACCAAAESGDILHYYETNAAFHEAIYTISGNSFLAEVTRGVRNRLHPFRKAQFSFTGRLKGSTAEHGAIVQAIVAQDAATAARLMRDHLKVVRTSVGEVAPNLRG